ARATNTLVYVFLVVFFPYEGFRCSFSSIPYDSRGFRPPPLIGCKHHSFYFGRSSSFARNTLRAEVGFIDFNCSFQPMLRLGPMENFTAQVHKDTRYRTPADTAKFSGVRSG